MPDLIYDLKDNKEKHGLRLAVRQWLRKQLIEEKLMNPFGIAVLVLTALFVAVVAGKFGTKGAVAILGAVVGMPLVIISFFNLRFGIIFMLTFQFFAGIIYRLVGGITWGVVVDSLISMLVFGVFVQQVGKRNWDFLKNPISLWVLIWILYNIIQVANPSAASRLAWVFSVRSMALASVLYYVALYAMTSLDYITKIFKLFIVLGLIGALYGLFQEYVFYPQYDLDAFIHNPRAYLLMFQAGKFRKFSIFGDPVLFGVIMAYMSIFCVILSNGPFQEWKKYFLRGMAFVCAFSMFFSGTRTAYVLIPVGFLFYVILSHKKEMMYALVFFGFFGTILVFIPTSNPTLYRFQTAFKPSDDASFNVRVINQRLIKPYIQSHPMGGGLGSTGEFGKRFSPGTFLANFPPDSGFVRVAVEQGWVGLFIYFALLFVVLREGVTGYFRCKDPLIKTYYAALVTVMYILCIASYPQEVLTLYPVSAVFCVTMAMITRLKEFDPAYAEEFKKAV